MIVSHLDCNALHRLMIGVAEWLAGNSHGRFYLRMSSFLSAGSFYRPDHTRSIPPVCLLLSTEVDSFTLGVNISVSFVLGTVFGSTTVCCGCIETGETGSWLSSTLEPSSMDERDSKRDPKRYQTMQYIP